MPTTDQIATIRRLNEAIGRMLLTLGLFTRVAAFVASGEMAVAYFIGHAPHGPWPGANEGDAAILYCFIFFYLVFAGSGSLALDGRVLKR